MDVVSNLVKANKDLVTAQNQDKEAIAKAEKTTEEKTSRTKSIGCRVRVC